MSWNSGNRNPSKAGGIKFRKVKYINEVKKTGHSFKIKLTGSAKSVFYTKENVTVHKSKLYYI